MNIFPQTSPPSTAAVPLRRADNNERFVAFAFAAADLVAEIEPSGRITYAAGAFRAKLGESPDAFVGRPIQSFIARADHPALEAALLLLQERGRLTPVLIRLANLQQTQLALAGLVLASTGCPTRLCLTLAVPPAPLGDAPQIVASRAFARTAEARLRAGDAVRSRPDRGRAAQCGSRL